MIFFVIFLCNLLKIALSWFTLKHSQSGPVSSVHWLYFAFSFSYLRFLSFFYQKWPFIRKFVFYVSVCAQYVEPATGRVRVDWAGHLQHLLHSLRELQSSEYQTSSLVSLHIYAHTVHQCAYYTCLCSARTDNISDTYTSTCSRMLILMTSICPWSHHSSVQV